MDGEQLYMLGCRFPKEVIPIELRADIPRVSYDEKFGWVGEYWYYMSDSVVPRMYVKLQLPEGWVLEIKKITRETSFSPAVSVGEMNQKQAEYLAQCVRVMADKDAPENECGQLTTQWMNLHTEEEKMWFLICQTEGKGEAAEASPPPQWLTDYWTVQRVRAVLQTELGKVDYSWTPTNRGQQLWHFGRVAAAAKACVPAGLEPGLPRLSYSKQHGWVAEYWYYYANAGLGFWMFSEPKYYMKICLATGQLMKARSITGEFQFRQSWLDAWASWMYKKELDYLAHCENLMEKTNPTEDDIAELEGMWLEAHPKEHAFWLASHARVQEAAVRWILSAGRIPNRDLLHPLWFAEMIKGVTLGTPDMAEQCTKALAEIGRYPVI